MDGAIERPQLDHLGARRGDKAAVRGAAAGGSFRLNPELLLHGPPHRLDQGRAARQKWVAGQDPLDPMFHVMAFEDFLNPAAQFGIGHGG